MEEVTKQPAVSILVLNWNGQHFLERCLLSLQAQTYRAFEVILVDNGSSDGSMGYVKERFSDWLAQAQLPHLRLLELSHNSGFSGGNIAALAATSPASRFIATLNNDTWADAGWLSELVEALENNSKWGSACGPMLFASAHGQAAEKIASAGIEVRRDGLALDRKLGQNWQAGETPQEIFGPCAGAALYRRSALDAVGFFDPAFFAYLEDADLAWRLRLAGWPTLYLPDAKVWHEYSGTGGQGSPFKNFQLGRNRVWVLFKNWPTGLLLRYAPRILFYDLAASLYTLLKGNPHSLRGRLAALRLGHLRRVWEQRKLIQSRRVASLNDLEGWLERPATPAESLRLRRVADELAVSMSTPTETPR